MRGRHKCRETRMECQHSQSQKWSWMLMCSVISDVKYSQSSCTCFQRWQLSSPWIIYIPACRLIRGGCGCEARTLARTQHRFSTLSQAAHHYCGGISTWAFKLNFLSQVMSTRVPVFWVLHWSLPIDSPFSMLRPFKPIFKFQRQQPQVPEINHIP